MVNKWGITPIYPIWLVGWLVHGLPILETGPALPPPAIAWGSSRPTKCSQEASSLDMTAEESGKYATTCGKFALYQGLCQNLGQGFGKQCPAGATLTGRGSQREGHS